LGQPHIRWIEGVEEPSKMCRWSKQKGVGEASLGWLRLEPLTKVKAIHCDSPNNDRSNS